MPRMSHRIALFALTFFVITLIIGCSSSTSDNLSETLTTNKVIVKPLTEYTPQEGDLELIQNIRKHKDPEKELHEIYYDLTVIDIHNHDAVNQNAVNKWKQFGIDRIVLFGNISEPSAQTTDQLAWIQYQKDPSHIYPSFAGFPIYEEEGLSIVKEKLEQGYLNIGEVAAASIYSPVVSKLEWKAEHPNDGNLPQIYDLAAKYHTPILLHIDPPNGTPIMYLEEALEQHPDTIIIFGHANAYNSPSNIETLLAKHPNLYIDFFAGFTAYNNESTNTLEDFVPLIEQYPDKFMISTDSGYGLSTEQAANALYEIIDLLSPETALKVAYQNYERLVELEPPTDYQIETIKELSTSLEKFETYHLNKRMANELIFELTKSTER
ncbi:amidohydrolase family protein [Paenibacillus endoradicis]|uniref:amidohydrolase family protein n=1 Tax=Paenibacillus endoradicis TaxID=2972487 RepID=UPI002159004C|nr:amidohydrolase [Paenibacillus endoradicis]MCR8658708.1 amidohydrolase [Paenibacillus endoradicis]